VTLITLACQAYRLKHGTLPEDLEQLQKDDFLQKIPNDPLSGRAFVYFPQGIPEPCTDSERRAFAQARANFRGSEHLTYDKIEPGVPCLWSPGLHLYTQVVTPDVQAPDIVEVIYAHRSDLRYRGGYSRDLP